MNWWNRGAHGADSQPARLFVQRYLGGNPLSIEPGLPFYKACTFLKLAAKEARRKSGDWQRSVAVLSDLAYQELDRI